MKRVRTVSVIAVAAFAVGCGRKKNKRAGKASLKTAAKEVKFGSASVKGSFPVGDGWTETNGTFKLKGKHGGIDGVVLAQIQTTRLAARASTRPG